MDGASEAHETSKRLCGLSQIVDRQTVDQVLDQYGTGRYCKRVDNFQLVWLIVGFGLFSGKSYRELFRVIASPVAWIPPRATICLARKRIGAAVLECLHDTIVSLLAVSPRTHPDSFYRGLRLMAVDGTLLDAYDSDFNRQAFGRTSNQSGFGAFPKVRVVSLCELGTRVLWKSVIGRYHDSEQTLVGGLFKHLNQKTLLLADRHFGVGPILFDLFKRKTPFLIRVKKGRVLRVQERLSDGSYLSTVYRRKNDRACRRPGRTVRVIKYTLNDPGRCGHGEIHVLITSLLDEKQYPAKELICLYHERWEEEIAFKEWKHALGEGRVLRSQSPDFVRQEIWGSLIAHFVIRKLIIAAADEAGVPPSKISFTSTVSILQLQLGDVPRGPRRKRQWLKRVIEVISREILPPRQNRINPRVVKKRSKSVPSKQDRHRRPPKPEPVFEDTIQISI